MPIRKYTYRKTPTPLGLKAMESGTLKHFDTEMFSNFNTGVLEEYLEEKNRKDGFTISTWTWWKIMVVIAIGAVFALINQYVGLKVGTVISGSWYIVYLMGLALRWRPSEVNIASSASSGAAMICTGFVFSFPAIYLLAYSEDYIMVGGKHLITEIPPLSVAIVSVILAGFLGIFYFIIFRRIWLVEDPLPVPGFEATVKLLDITNDVSRGAAEQAKRSITIVGISTGIVMLFTFLRDFPLYDSGLKDKFGKAIMISPFDNWFGGETYAEGTIMVPYKYDKSIYTHLEFGLIPIQIGIGWFMRFKIAFLVSLGSFLTWFVIVPLAIAINVPFYNPSFDGYFTVNGYPPFVAGLLGVPLEDIEAEGLTPAILSYARVARVVAIGAILGGGFTALIKMAPVFKTATADLRKIGVGERKDFVKGKGWFEWPVSHIIYMAGIVLIGIIIVFTAGGYPLIDSIILAILLVVTTFFLGAIAVKVMGETGSEPVSATTFIVLLMLIIVFQAIGTPVEITAPMALVGCTVFGGAISMSGDIVMDFKNGQYIGNRPYHLVKAVITGLIPGAIVAGVAASLLSLGLAKGYLNLVAPQANAFATFTLAILGGGIRYELLFLGVGIGVFVELTIGLGTAFGLGMYFPLSLTLPMLLGGAMRDVYDKYYLQPTAKKYSWTEKQITLKELETFMVATGLIVGEALMGTIVAIYLVIPLITGG